jgi:nucleotidyltransferase/DNA polymerase involved in DNA repair
LEFRALVLYAAGRRGQVVAACSPGASKAGVAAGMPLAEARALAADAHFATHEPRADREALRRLAEWCQQFSPEVALEEVDQPESLFLDITGSGHLYGSEKALAQTVVDELGRHGYWCRAAVADTVGAARALAGWHATRSAANDGCHGFGTPNPCEPAGVRPDCRGTGRTGSGVPEPVAPDIRACLPSGHMPTQSGGHATRTINSGTEVENDGCHDGWHVHRSGWACVRTEDMLTQGGGHATRTVDSRTEAVNATRTINSGTEVENDGCHDGWHAHRFGWACVRTEDMPTQGGGHATRTVDSRTEAANATRTINSGTEVENDGWHAHRFGWACLPSGHMPTQSGGHATHSTRSSPGPVVVPPCGQREALSPLPVEALRLSPAVVQMLHRLDVRRVGQLLDLPRAALPSRFGNEILHRIDQALGHIPELLIPEPIPEPVEAAREFEPETDDWQVIEAVCERLLEQIVERLQHGQRGIRRLECSLRTTAGEVPLSVGLLQPSASVPHLMSLVRLYCERLRIEGEISALIVRAAEVVPLEFCQTQLFDAETGADRWRAFPGLIERLSNRLGEKAVLRPRLWPDAQPEYAYRFEPWLGQKVSAVPPDASPGNDERRPRPPCLKSRPVAVPVLSLVPDGPPQRFVWQEEWHDIAYCWGPERIETGWWRCRDVRRDYYLVESTSGKRFWLFRAVRDGNWFLHGTFA